MHQELPLTRMEVQLATENPGREKHNEFNFNIISTIRSFTLSAKTAQIREEWMKVLTDTINQFQTKRSSYQSTGKVENQTEPSLGQQVYLT